jgi:FkbM family methyltransferase
MRHPLGARDKKGTLSRWARWKIGSRILGGAAVMPFVGDTVLIVQPGMTGATGNIYVGLHEFADMAFLLHFLRPEDRFIDAGANVGAYSILASGVCCAETLAVEPIPSTFKHLQANVRINDLTDRIRTYNRGLASHPGKLRFTRSLDTVNHVVTDAKAQAAEGVDVEVTTLDALTGDHPPSLIKVDVEGFETEVFAGGARTLSDPALCALIVEINGSGKSYGFDDEELRRRIESFGFRSYDYEPFTRRLDLAHSKTTVGNALYVRDIDSVVTRLRSARPVHLYGVTF